MKNIIPIIAALLLLSCGVKKELQSASEQNTQLSEKLKKLEAKQIELEKQNKILIEQNQEAKRKLDELARENNRLKSSNRKTEPMLEVESVGIYEGPSKEASVDQIFKVVEKMPEYPGGYEAMFNYLNENTNYPSRAEEEGIRGKVYVEFVVQKDSNLANIKVIRGLGYGCDEEAVRLVEDMPKWTPGEQRGNPVIVKMVLPISFGKK